MNLIVDHSIAAGNVRVPCYQCSKMLPLSEALIDLAGPPFQAYYHLTCLPPNTALPSHNPPTCHGAWDCVRPVGKA